MKQSQLDEFRSEVNFSLAIGALADFELPVTANDGGCPVVVAMEDEAFSTVLGRLRAVGGYANLFVRCEEQDRLVSVIEDGSALMEASDDMSGEGEGPSPDATVGMFLEWVERCPHGVKISAAVGHPAYAKDAQNIELESV